MSSLVGENLQRLMAQQGISAAQLSRCTGLDRRTIRGLLTGKTRPHWRTLQRLAEGLGVCSEELLFQPVQRLYRRLDRQSNPAVGELISQRPELFDGWRQEDFDELFSRVGTGGPLTREGALRTVEQMNQNRHTQQQLALLLETSYAELVRRLIEALASLVLEPANAPLEKASSQRRRSGSGRKPLSTPPPPGGRPGS